MRVATQARRPRTSQLESFPAPVGGWIANRNLAQPKGNGLPPGAAVLENWFPVATGAIIRRGSELYATLGSGGSAVTAMFSYKNGNQEELFAATATTIYDITTITSAESFTIVDEDDEDIVDESAEAIGAESTTGLETVEGQTGGDWVSLQFQTSGGTYLVNVNGTDDLELYDGTDWFPIDDEDIFSLDYDAETAGFTVGETLTGGTSGASANIVKVIDDGTTGTLWIGDITSGPFQDNETITDGATGSATADGTTTQIGAKITASGINTEDFSYVWEFKNRVFFVEKESLNAWYLAADAIGGTATKLPLGGVFSEGGSLLMGESWSIESGDGLSERCAFVTDEGEVAVYAGANPGDANDWALVGVYKIGLPLGKHAWIRAGGDLVFATNVGFVPLSVAMRRDFAALSPAAVSYPVEEAWNDAVELRAGNDWYCDIWPSAQMAIVALPTTGSQPARWFVANAVTGAWAPFTGWDATCVEIFQTRCFYGTPAGLIVEANVTGQDQGQPYTASYLPLFDDLASPGSLKIADMARAVVRGNVSPNIRISTQFDFDVNLPAAPDATIIGATSTWGSAIWGTSVWDDALATVISQDWQSVGGTGYMISTATQITSGDTVPLDTQIVRVDVTFETADIVT